jgi:hypothetical protein
LSAYIAALFHKEANQKLTQFDLKTDNKLTHDIQKNIDYSEQKMLSKLDDFQRNLVSQISLSMNILRELQQKQETTQQKLKTKVSKDEAMAIEDKIKFLAPKRSLDILHEIVDLKADSDQLTNVSWRVERQSERLE